MKQGVVPLKTYSGRRQEYVSFLVIGAKNIKMEFTEHAKEVQILFSHLWHGEWRKAAFVKYIYAS